MGPELLLLHNELLVFAMMILLDPAWAGEGSKAVYIPHKCSQIPHKLEFVTNFKFRSSLEFSTFVRSIYCYNVKYLVFLNKINLEFLALIVAKFLLPLTVIKESFEIMHSLLAVVIHIYDILYLTNCIQ